MDQETVRAFATRVNQGDLGPSVQLKFAVAGGMPSQRLESEVVVDAVNGARISRYDALVSNEELRSSVRLDEINVRELFEGVSRGLFSLTPFSERVTRLPDALAGRLTIVVDGAEEAFHVIPKGELGPAERLAPAMDRALELLWDLATGASRQDVGSDRA